jgi:hypothetical protein
LVRFGAGGAEILTLLLTDWELKPFFVKMKISPGRLRKNIFLKIKNASQKI